MKVERFIRNGLSPAEMAEELGTARTYMYVLLKKLKLAKQAGVGPSRRRVSRG